MIYSEAINEEGEILSKKKKFRIGLPIKLGLIIVFSLLFGEYLHEDIKCFAYATSLSIKEVLIFVLPVVIFSYLFSCILSLRQGALLFITLLLGGICLSNFISVMVGYEVATIYVQKVERLSASVNVGEALIPYWSFSLPEWIPNQWALFSGLVLGWLLSYAKSDRIGIIADNMRRASDFFLRKLFIPIVPIFILGFVLNLQHGGALETVLRQYGPIFLLIGVVAYLYIAILFAIAAKFSLEKWLLYVRNSIPSLIAGFSTMSSAASLPLTLRGAEKNTGQPEKVQAVVPATINVHLIGDSIGIPVTAMAVMLTFGHPLPTLSSFLVFAFYFVIQKFAVAGVPGGGILVMLPVLQTQLGFDASMISLITAIYIMLDAITSSANVLGNGAFAILFTKLLGRMKWEK